MLRSYNMCKSTVNLTIMVLEISDLTTFIRSSSTHETAAYKDSSSCDNNGANELFYLI